MNDWFNTHWALQQVFPEHTEQNIRIVFLDGHAKSALDDVWSTAFDAETMYVSQLPRDSCFERAVWIPKATPLWDKDAPSKCTLDSFVERVLRAYRIERPSTLSDVPLIIDRKPYMAHPRSKMRIDRAMPNLAETFPSARVVDLATMTFADQLRLIVGSRVLIGLHGAALTHLIWMGPQSVAVEWIAKSHESVLLFKHIATWRPGVSYRRTQVPKTDAELRSQFPRTEVQSPPAMPVSVARSSKPIVPLPVASQKRLAVIVPFRDDDGQDKLSQGIGRWANLQEFVPTMCKWLSRAGRTFDIVTIEQAPGGTFNKGKLFNAGIMLNPEYDYYALHDVDQVPTNPKNSYPFPAKRPVHLCVSTKQNSNFDYVIVGGVLLISKKDYLKINGYSNNFVGWGQEDQDMAQRIKKVLGGYDRLSPEVGKYRALDHERVMGLDETEVFRDNAKHLRRTMRGEIDPTDGVSSLRYELLRDEPLPYECPEGMLGHARIKTVRFNS
eukprot:g66.t1